MTSVSQLGFLRRWFFPFSIALTAFSGIGFAQSGVHPGYTLTALRPTGFEPRVSGIDFLPDGRMVICTWDNFTKTSSVYLLTNTQTGDKSQVTYTKIAGNLFETLGLKVVDGKIYVVEKHQVSLLENTDADDSIENVKKIAGGWGLSTTPPPPPANRNLEFAFGLPYKNGKFYVGLATAWPIEQAQTEIRGSILEVDAVTGTYTTMAAGMRTPDGMVLGPQDELFSTENEGNWVPTSKLVHVKQGRFFGVKKRTVKMPFEDSPVTPPVVWIPKRRVSISPTQPVYLKQGVFAGQMIAGDNNLLTLRRYFIEKVGGEYQGAVFLFSSGLEAAAHRIVTGPDGAIYIGELGAPSGLWPGWTAKDQSMQDQLSGLQRMASNGKDFFDWKAVRSAGPGLMELEFTQPLGAGADQVSKYAVSQRGFTPVESYGSGEGSASNVTVKTATLSADKKRVTLAMDGLRLGNEIYIKLTGIVSATGATALWSTESWYTLNKVGPGVDVIDTNSTGLANSVRGHADFTALSAGGSVRLEIPFTGRFKADIRDVLGNLHETIEQSGPGQFTGKPGLSAGMYTVSVKSAGLVKTRRVAVLAK